MTFQGRIELRSTQQDANGPPGESQIQALNPRRKLTICQRMRWGTLAPGSMNLIVDHQTVHLLLAYETLIVEDARGLVYPDEFEHIPRHRVGYLYYPGTLLVGARVGRRGGSNIVYRPSRSSASRSTERSRSVTTRADPRRERETRSPRQRDSAG